MTERRRCHSAVYVGQLDLKDGCPTKALRAICDRPIGHSGSSHKGRLLVGSDVWGIVEWAVAS